MIEICDKPYGCIYILTNEITNKVYIGKTKNYTRRINEHKNRKPNSDKYKYKLVNVIDEYGFENFSYRILDNCKDENDMNIKEIYYITYYKSDIPKYGYNSKEGGNGGKMNILTRMKMSDTHKGLKEKPETKRKKSNTILAVKDNICYISDSAKLFGDTIDMSKDKVKNALRMPCRIKEYYVFYLEDSKRHEIYDKSSNDTYKTLSRLIDNGVETIKKEYQIEYIRYT